MKTNSIEELKVLEKYLYAEYVKVHKKLHKLYKEKGIWYGK